MLCRSCKHPLPPPDPVPTAEQLEGLRQMSRSPHIPHDAPLVLASSISLLERYDALIQQMRDRIGELQADRARIQLKINAYTSIEAPVRRIPAELLCLIFHYFAQYEGGCDGLSVTGLLRISAVCSIWRNIFIGLPRLWANIIVDEKDWPRDNRKKGRRLLDALRLSLERSTPHPWTLTLSFPDILPNEVMPLLANESKRWQRLALDSSGRPALTIPSNFGIKGRLDTLQELRLAHNYNDSSGVLETAPKLTHVTLVRSDYPRLPWNQLLSLTYQPLGGFHLPSVVLGMAYLSRRGAAFVLKGAPSILLHDLPEITSPISSLTIGIGQMVGPVLGCLTLPRLHTLSIVPPLTQWPTEYFESLSVRSSFDRTLRVLQIRGVIIAQKDLISALELLPSLERLEISDHSSCDVLTDAALRRLTLTPEQDVDEALVPQLKYLRYNSYLCFTPNVFLDFVLSRTTESSGEPLFEVVICRLREESTGKPRWKGKQFDPEPLWELEDQGRLLFQFYEF